MNTSEDITINRTHKDRLFRFIFREKPALLSLYNAVNGSSYTDPEELEIYTMENFVYMGLKNDLSFLIDDAISLYEHQSTMNKNLPLRGLFYLSSALQKYVALKDMDIYASKQIEIPMPQYYVFYNGEQRAKEIVTLKLTDSMAAREGRDPEELSCIQVTAHMLNINAGHSPSIMEKCPLLREYSEFVAKVREFQAEDRTSGVNLSDTVKRAVDYCINNNILRNLLLGHRAEVTDIMLSEYDEALHIATEKQISYEEGVEAGLEQGREEERANTERERLRTEQAEQKQKEAEQKQKEAEQQQERMERQMTVVMYKHQGISEEEISRYTGLPLEAVQEILSQRLPVSKG